MRGGLTRYARILMKCSADEIVRHLGHRNAGHPLASGRESGEGRVLGPWAQIKIRR